MKRSSLATAVVGACLLLGVAACGSSGGGTTTSGAPKYTIGVVGFDADATGADGVKGYIAEAKAKGWTTVTVDGSASADQMVSAIQDMVSRKVAAIYVSVYPASQLTAGLIAAKAAKIPVMSLAGGLGDGIEANWAAGSADGKLVAKQFVTDMASKGQLLVLGNTPGLVCQLREQALKAALVGTSITTIRQEIPVPGDVQAGQNDTNAWLAKHPAGDGNLAIWSCTDNGALGAIAALKSQHRTDVKVYGLNGEPGALSAIQDGTLAATAWVNTYAAGQQMADATPQIIAAGTTTTTPIQRDVPSVLITRSTIGAFLKAHPSAASGK